MPNCPECAATLTDVATSCSTCGAVLRTSPAEITSQPKVSKQPEEARLLEALRASLAPRYELLKPLGSGGMGAVFLAREPALKRLVAIKVLSPYLVAHATAHARFEREARAVAALSHPNVVSVYAIGETVDLSLPYIVMQYVDGPPLSAWIQEHGRASEREARRILGGVAAALAAAHARGLVHRDVKPGNILLEPTSSRVLVVDFGLASALSKEGSGVDDTTLTTAGMVLGTPIYMSPEQAMAEPVSAKSDVYSLGVVAYELLTGKLPFTATSAMGWATAHLRDIPCPVGQLRPDLSPEVGHLVDRCLAKAATARPTAQEFAEGILPSLEAEVQWPPPGFVPLLGRGRILARSAQLTAFGILLLLVALVTPPRPVRAEDAWWTDFAIAPAVTGSSLGVRRESPRSSAAGIPRWWFAALALGLGGAIAGSTWLGVLSYPAMRSIARHQRAGWRWSTMSDVLADPDGRSGLLLSGSREIAAIAPDHRAGILQVRRRIMSAGLLGGLWVVVVGGGWALLLVLGVQTIQQAGPIARLALWVVLVTPLAVSLGVALAAAAREARLFGALPRKRIYTGTFAAPRSLGGGQDAAAWYAGLPGGQLPGTSRPAVFSGALSTAYLAAVLLGAAALVAMGLVSAATVVAARRASQLGPETAEGAALLEQRDGGAFGGQAREAWSAYLPPREDISDSGARTLIRKLVKAEGTSGDLPSYPVDPAKVISTLAPDTLGHGAFQAAQRGLSPDTAGLLETLGEHPRTTVLRRIARAPTVDIFGSTLDRPVGDYGTLDRLPQPQYGIFRTAAHANGLGALLAASREDWSAAARRLGENLALAEHFLRAPSVFANRYGVGLLQQLALLPLAEVERLRGNRDQAQRLTGAGDQIREEVFTQAWPGRLAGLAADPGDLSRFSAALRSDRLSPGYRVESFYGGWAGFCLNRWEILSGPSPFREPAVMKTSDAMTDVPHAGELARLTARTWESESRASLGNMVSRLLWCWRGGRAGGAKPPAASR
jgi:hypothetical protein